MLVQELKLILMQNNYQLRGKDGICGKVGICV